MKITLYLTLLAICLNGCDFSFFRKDLNIPDSVAIKKTEKYIQIRNTRIFIVPPKGYTTDKTGQKLYLGKNAEILVLEKPNRGFQQAYEDHIKLPVSKMQGNPFQSEVQYAKRFRIGADSAALVLITDTKTKISRIDLVIGSEFKSMFITSSFPTNQSSILKEILASIQTAYMDHSITIDYESIATFSFDVSGERFAYSHRENEIAFYTYTNTVNSYVSSIAIIPSMYPLTIQDLNTEMPSLIQKLMDKKTIQQIPNYEQVEINGYKGIHLSYYGKYPTGDAQVYHLFLSSKETAVTYLCFIDPSDKALFETAKSLAKNIRLK